MTAPGLPGWASLRLPVEVPGSVSSVLLEPARSAEDELDVVELLERVWDVPELLLPAGNVSGPAVDWSHSEHAERLPQSLSSASSPTTKMNLRQEDLDLEDALKPAWGRRPSTSSSMELLPDALPENVPPCTHTPAQDKKPQKQSKSRRSLMTQRERNRRCQASFRQRQKVKSESMVKDLEYYKSRCAQLEQEVQQLRCCATSQLTSFT